MHGKTTIEISSYHVVTCWSICGFVFLFYRVFVISFSDENYRKYYNMYMYNGVAAALTTTFHQPFMLTVLGHIFAFTFLD